MEDALEGRVVCGTGSAAEDLRFHLSYRGVLQLLQGRCASVGMSQARQINLQEGPSRGNREGANGGIDRISRWIPLILFLTNLFLVYSFFLPNLRDINLWDEAAIVSSGRALLEGRIPIFASSPLTAALYAVLTIPFRSSPFWLIQACAAGRLVLFCLLWIGTYLVARQLDKRTAAVVMLGLLLVTPISLDFLRFPTDPLFASMAAISFSFVLAYRRSGNVRDVLWASFFLGLAALARNDGLILFLVFVPIVVFLCARRSRWYISLAAAVGPFIALVGGYVLLVGALTGSYGLGTAQRTYDNFESGQAAAYQGSGETNAVIEARLEARRLFGTPQENGYSVLRAIQRNPKAYLARLKAITLSFPDAVLHAYGIRFAAVILLLVVRGIVDLVRRRDYRQLGIMALWPAPLVTGFVITLFRPGHTLFPFYVMFALAGIGLATTLDNLERRSERLGWSIVLGLLAAYTLAANKLAVFYGVSILLLALWLCMLIRSGLRETRAVIPASLLVLACAGVIVRGGFPSPTLPALGMAADEQAVLYMHDHFPPGTPVAAGAPGAVVMAGMSSATLAAADVPTNRSPEGFLQWMRDQGIKAVYVDPLLTGEDPAIWTLIEKMIGNGLERVFVAEGGDYQILLVEPPG